MDTRPGNHEKARRMTSPAPFSDELFDLWDHIADLPASQTDEALEHFMRTVAGWIGADNALWVGAVRLLDEASADGDPQHGWRGRVVRPLMVTPRLSAKTAEAVRGQDTDPGMTTRALTAEAGRFRVRRLHDGFVDFAAFEKTEHYRRLYAAVGIVDRIWVFVPVGDDAEVCFLFDLMNTERRFDASHAELAGKAARALKWFHRQTLLTHGLMLASSPLTPSERDVLRHLLTGKSEKQIAAELGRAYATTHQHVKGIFRKFGVKSRSEIMALWLR